MGDGCLIAKFFFFSLRVLCECVRVKMCISKRRWYCGSYLPCWGGYEVAMKKGRGKGGNGRFFDSCTLVFFLPFRSVEMANFFSSVLHAWVMGYVRECECGWS